MSQPKWKSKVFWVTVFAFLLFIMKNYGLLEIVGLTEESYNQLTVYILTFISIFAAWNSPESKDRL